MVGLCHGDVIHKRVDHVFSGITVKNIMAFLLPCIFTCWSPKLAPDKVFVSIFTVKLSYKLVYLF